MKNNYSPVVYKKFARKCTFTFVILLCVFFATCHNPIMERLWDDGSPSVSGPVTGGYGGSGENFGAVRFNTNGGAPQPQELKIAWGSIVGRLRPISRGNDGFIGWFDELGDVWDVETRQVGAQDDANNDGFITLTARWNASSHDPSVPNPVPAFNHTVSFVTNLVNISVSEQIIASGNRVVEPAPIIPGDGRALAGWYTDPHFSPATLWNFSANIVTGNMTLYARYSYQTRTVHFEPNAGTRPDGVTELTRVNFTIYIPDSGEGGRIIDPGPLVREGHAFGGWFTDPNFNPATLWNFATDRVTERDEDPGLGDYFHLFAQWIPNIYLVTFNASGGSPAVITASVAHGERVEKPTVTNPGKVLVGWYNNTDFSGAPWDFNTGVTASMSLHARWEDTIYVVRFHAGNPNGALPHLVFVNNWPSEQRVSRNGTVTEPFMPPLPPANQGSAWSFYRWYYNPNPGVNDPARVNDATFRAALQPWNFESDTVRDSVIIEEIGGARYVLNLYAKWVPPVTGMVWVPRGRFIMGDSGVSGSPAAYHAFPTRIVTVDGFYISKTEVTQAQYRDLMTGKIPNTDPSNKNGNNNPVERVSWFDAVYFSYWLTQATQVTEPNLNQVYDINVIRRAGDGGAAVPDKTISGSISEATVAIRAANRQANGFPNGFRLPTEAEWEFAARGGHGSPNNFIFAGSNSAEAVAWFNETVKTMLIGATQEVGTRAHNALGIFDMSGNVSEWCWDWFGSYNDIINAHPSVEAYNNPKGPLSGIERVRRGGAWNNAAGNVRSVVRNSAAPDNANWVIGFRVVRGPSEVW